MCSTYPDKILGIMELSTRSPELEAKPWLSGLTELVLMSDEDVSTVGRGVSLSSKEGPSSTMLSSADWATGLGWNSVAATFKGSAEVFLLWDAELVGGCRRAWECWQDPTLWDDYNMGDRYAHRVQSLSWGKLFVTKNTGKVALAFVMRLNSPITWRLLCPMRD